MRLLGGLDPRVFDASKLPSLYSNCRNFWHLVLASRLKSANSQLMGRPSVAILAAVITIGPFVWSWSLKSANSHKEGASLGHDPCNPVTLRPSCRRRASKVTGMLLSRLKSACSHRGLPGGLQPMLHSEHLLHEALVKNLPLTRLKQCIPYKWSLGFILSRHYHRGENRQHRRDQEGGRERPAPQHHKQPRGP